MSKRVVVPKEKPKKPMTHYFLFRAERLAALEGQENRNNIIKEEWANLSQEIKDAEKEKFKKEMDKYNYLIAEWRKVNPGDTSKGKGKKEEEVDDEEEEKPKGEKTKGAAKAGKKGKKEEEEVKPDKGKSKPKKEEKAEVDPKSKKVKK